MLLSPFRGFISGREGFLVSKRVFPNRECMFVNEWAWLTSRVCLVLCPARMRLPVRNGLVNEVEFLGLITQTG